MHSSTPVSDLVCWGIFRYYALLLLSFAELKIQFPSIGAAIFIGFSNANGEPEEAE